MISASKTWKILEVKKKNVSKRPKSCEQILKFKLRKFDIDIYKGFCDNFEYFLPNSIYIWISFNLKPN